MRRLEQITTPYNDVDVIERKDGGIDFDVIGATHATWHPTLLLTGHAWDAITAGAMMHPGEPATLLLLGLGGGTVLRQIRHFLPRIHIRAVEIDPVMIRLAREYMALDELDVEIVEADAYEFLDQDKGRYDLFIDDLYRCGDRDVERPADVNRDTVEKMAEKLLPGGALIMNFVLGRGHARLHRRARGAFAHHFGAVRAVRPPLSHNEVIVGTALADGLRSPRQLNALKAFLNHDQDQRYWKELRNLKLR
ncbi:MAG: fused MFS/spermidine synthase [Verrucomicrobia bacterium]|nr:fused MFS/spermidine synthase [Verrucomicrobiota bacterium]MCH8513304.1 fused MFS/spermidine synthase [Kiritimatiellia bacterium]